MRSHSRSMHAPEQCFRHPILFLVQNGSNIRHSDVSSVISGAVVEDAVTSPRSSGKPNNNHLDIHVGRPYQYVAFVCLICVKGDQCVCFFVTALKVAQLSNHQIMIVVVVHHHACSTMFNSGSHNVRYDTVFSLGPFNINKSQLLLPLLGLLAGVKPRMKLLALVIPYSGDPKVRYDTVFSLGPFNVNKSQFRCLYVVTPFGVAGRGKASHEIA